MTTKCTFSVYLEDLAPLCRITLDDRHTHCAGIRGPVGVPVVEGDAAEWRQIFEINTIGAFVVTKAVAKDMIRRNQGGKIVHIASAAGKLGAPGSAAYAASKWAVIGLVQSLALELAKYKSM